MNPEIKVGSLSWSESSASFAESVVSVEGKSDEDRPFSSIVEVFRFAFSIGFLKEKSKKREGNPVTVAPRFMSSTDYYDLLENIALDEKKSLGQIISDYAEGGVELMVKAKEKGNILSLLE